MNQYAYQHGTGFLTVGCMSVDDTSTMDSTPTNNLKLSHVTKEPISN